MFLYPFKPGTPRAQPYEAPTPGSGWGNGWGDSSGNTPTPGSGWGNGWGDASGNAQSTYAPSTPMVQPMTPVPSASYSPGTPGGQPMTPGDAGMDLMSPVIGSPLGFLYCRICIEKNYSAVWSSGSGWTGADNQQIKSSYRNACRWRG